MSEELIRRGDVIKAVRECRVWHFCELVPILSVIKDIPTVESKHGEWVEVQISERFKRMVCSECGDSYVADMITPLEAWIDNRHRFCPNCGADMRGKER